MHRFFADESGIVDGHARLNAEDSAHALRVVRLETGEEIELVELPVREALAMVRDGRIVDAKTVILLQRLALERAGLS